MTGRPKDPKTARNKNVLVIGGSGSGKTRFYVKPNLMQCFPTSDYPTSFVVTDPKGTLVLETGQMFQRAGYRVKILNTINFSKHFKDKKSHYVSEDEWTIFENTHEAIIDQQTFDLVQKIRSNVRRYPNGWGEAAPLTGLLYCADCGGKMYVHRTNNGKRISQYTCSNYTKVPCGTLCPTQHRINESAVLTLVSDTLRAIAEYSRNDRTEFIHTVQETQVAQQSADISKKRRRLAAAQKRAGELEKLICKIYEDNALGKLPDARYRALDAQYAKEQDALEIEIAELEKAVTGYEQSQKSAEKFIALIDKYENFDTLTNTMLNEFVEKILVHERARKRSLFSSSTTSSLKCNSSIGVFSYFRLLVRPSR